LQGRDGQTHPNYGALLGACLAAERIRSSVRTVVLLAQPVHALLHRSHAPIVGFMGRYASQKVSMNDEHDSDVRTTTKFPP